MIKSLNSLRQLVRTLWRDCRGTTSPMNLILTTSIFTVGTIVGLVAVRDHLAQQFGDVATGLDQLDQSWSYSTGIDLNGDGDFNDPGECEMSGQFVDTSNLTDDPGSGPAGLSFVP